MVLTKASKIIKAKNKNALFIDENMITKTIIPVMHSSSK